MSKFQIGDQIKVRAGAELKYPDQFKLTGTVVETADLPAYGEAIRIHWADQEKAESSFSQATLFEHIPLN
ncbi:hypothetical protein [Rhizobium leguminosarum]|uniref:hypothetical protein n=1 Tax=Rhizobium leguminosarum TaxID=384 RepID=UPI0015D99966|nr:hypothetical protein [Rhizobium leguminosarum]NZD54183.1 hypothetical protein [Rhizobium leguminosarum]